MNKLAKDKMLHSIVYFYHNTSDVVYKYQADCDSICDEISHDFENGTTEMGCLADWDTMISNIYVKWVIRYLL